mmetsp:Transcript_139170/g.444688  ORF Transcript_139170/g.444688 Transcript_139170/m.444688 type:complete len:248 (+) Transcript_139170:3713-4456(+)
MASLRAFSSALCLHSSLVWKTMSAQSWKKPERMARSLPFPQDSSARWYCRCCKSEAAAAACSFCARSSSLRRSSRASFQVATTSCKVALSEAMQYLAMACRVTADRRSRSALEERASPMVQLQPTKLTLIWNSLAESAQAPMALSSWPWLRSARSLASMPRRSSLERIKKSRQPAQKPRNLASSSAWTPSMSVRLVTMLHLKRSLRSASRSTLPVMHSICQAVNILRLRAPTEDMLKESKMPWNCCC